MTRKAIFIVTVLTIVATVVGFSQTLIYKICPPYRMELWFPLAVVAKALTHDDLAMVLAALVQFPLWAVALILGPSRWSLARRIVAVAFTHALLAGIAIAVVLHHYSRINIPYD